jgi:adenosylmethionine-8-amino-7-oxononanoate aminotransferase
VSAALENRGQLICGEEVPSASVVMLGVELVADRDAGPVAAAAPELGVIVRASGTKIVMSPPLVIEQDDADCVADVLAPGLEAL